MERKRKLVNCSGDDVTNDDDGISSVYVTESGGVVDLTMPEGSSCEHLLEALMARTHIALDQGKLHSKAYLVSVFKTSLQAYPQRPLRANRVGKRLQVHRMKMAPPPQPEVKKRKMSVKEEGKKNDGKSREECKKENYVKKNEPAKSLDDIVINKITVREPKSEEKTLTVVLPKRLSEGGGKSWRPKIRRTLPMSEES